MNKPFLLFTVLVLATGPATAADLKVLSAGAAKAAVVPLVEAFARASGHNVDIDFATMGLIQQKLKQGERADVLILAAEVAEVLAKSGAIVPASRKALAKVGVGVAVGENARVPDISTAAAFRQTLLDAKSIVMIDPALGTSGKHLVEVYQKLGITDALKTLNAALRNLKDRMPLSVELDLRPGDALHLRASHQLTQSLSDDDHRRISKWDNDLKSKSIRTVPFLSYQQAVLVSRSR